MTHYFDHAATSPIRPAVIDAMLAVWQSIATNASSLHQPGLLAKQMVDRARMEIARTIGASPAELIFTSSGTESNNLAILGIARRLRGKSGGYHVITTNIEHPSVMEVFKQLEREGYSVSYLSVDASGVVDLDELKRLVTPHTILISVMHVNNVTGAIQPIQEMSEIARQNGIVFHTDAVQSYGKIPVHVDQLHVDLLTIAAHKIGGPQGIAALYIKKGTRLSPLFFGGGHERRLRPSTLSTAGIVGFATAAKLALEERLQRWQLATQYREYLLDRCIPLPGVTVNNASSNHTSPFILNIRLDRVEGQALMLELDRVGISTSSGSACSSTDAEPSYVLLAMGQSRDVALESLRISMGWTTTWEDIYALGDALEGIVTEFRC